MSADTPPYNQSMTDSNQANENDNRNIFKKLLKVMKGEPGGITYKRACTKDNMSNFKRVKLDDKATDYVICSECDDKKLIRYVQEWHKDPAQSPTPVSQEQKGEV